MLITAHCRPVMDTPDPSSMLQSDEMTPGKRSPDPSLQPKEKVPDKQPADFFVQQPREEVLDKQSAAPTDTDSFSQSHTNAENLSSQDKKSDETPNSIAQVEKRKPSDDDPERCTTNPTHQRSDLVLIPSEEALSSPHSPNKLTISRRIQSALRLINQSSSTHQLETSDSDSLRETRSHSLPSTTKKTLSGMKWSQLKVDKDVLASVITGQEKIVKSSPVLKTANTEQNSHEEDNSVTTRHDSIQPASNDNQNSTAKQITKSGQTHKGPAPPNSTQTQVLADSTSPLKGTDARVAESHAVSVESERLALEEMRERRQREVELAHQSRLRMSRLISEEEIQQVSTLTSPHYTHPHTSTLHTLT